MCDRVPNTPSVLYQQTNVNILGIQEFTFRSYFFVLNEFVTSVDCYWKFGARCFHTKDC